MKSAYELALERLEQQGIEPPREEAFTDDQIAEMDGVRAKARAKIAELEILFKQSLEGSVDPEEQQKKEHGFHRERERIESRLERDINKLRAQSN